MLRTISAALFLAISVCTMPLLASSLAPLFFEEESLFECEPILEPVFADESRIPADSLRDRAEYQYGPSAINTRNYTIRLHLGTFHWPRINHDFDLLSPALGKSMTFVFRDLAVRKSSAKRSTRYDSSRGSELVRKINITFDALDAPTRKRLQQPLRSLLPVDSNSLPFQYIIITYTPNIFEHNNPEKRPAGWDFGLKNPVSAKDYSGRTPLRRTERLTLSYRTDLDNTLVSATSLIGEEAMIAQEFLFGIWLNVGLPGDLEQNVTAESLRIYDDPDCYST